MKSSAVRQTVPFPLALVCEICWIKKVKCHSIARNYRQIVDARSSAKFSLKSHAAAASVKQLMRAVIAQWSSKSVFLILSFAFRQILRALSLFGLISCLK
jgi:hypothetical protein